MSASLVYRVPPERVDSIICHKQHEGFEHYLVKWQSKRPKNAVLSWHNLSELASCMHLIQDYVKTIQTDLKPAHNDGKPLSRKRKSPHDEISSECSSAPSPASSFTSSSSTNVHRVEVYNGVLQRKGGNFVARELQSSDNGILKVDATQMPDAAMLQAAQSTSFYNALVQMRNSFIRKLAMLPGPKVHYINECDVETPSLGFRWISDYVLGEGVSRDADAVIEGCLKCKPDMGQNKGCEYTMKCACLELAAPDGTESGLNKMDNEQKVILRRWENNENVDTSRLPKRFPYTSTGRKSGCLESFYLNSRWVIYECNKKCKCGPGCKTRNVQHGRKVELEIFKTPNRGFGLRCLQPLRQGQFIDKYLGELITDAEADRREAATGEGRASYLFWLDKHKVDDDQLGVHLDDCYVADGEVMGGPTRFINHSCDPNVRLFAVSYNKYDERIYDLAFFALRDIAAEEELTFDYIDPEPDEDQDVMAENQRLRDLEMEEQGKKKVQCLCGAKKCRGFMWDHK